MAERHTIAVALLTCVFAAACSSVGAKPSVQPTSSSAPSPKAGHRLVVTTARAPWQLPSPLSRLVVVPDGAGAILAGGLTPADTSTNEVSTLDLSTGRVHRVGTVPQGFHDAAGAVIAGRVVIFGGGSVASTSTVQEIAESGRHRSAVIGHLPQPRSDLSAVTLGGAVYLLGGYTGVTPLADVLRTTDGTTFTKVATLPVTVRYAAVAALGSSIWVFGGEHGATPTRAIQRIDPTTGTAKVVGRLPAARSDAVAMVIDGRVFVVGGRGPRGQALTEVDELNPSRARVRVVAKLPAPVADAASIVAGSTAYIIGGETRHAVATVQTVVVRDPGGQGG